MSEKKEVKFRASKVMFFDLESTSLDPKLGSIHQFSGALYVNTTLIKGFQFHMTVPRDTLIEPKALEMSGKTLEQMYTGEGLQGPVLTQEEGYKAIVKMLLDWDVHYDGQVYRPLIDKYNSRDKVILGGYNINTFDMPFMQEWFSKMGDRYFFSYFHGACLDVKILAMDYLRDEVFQLDNFKLETVAEYMMCAPPVNGAGFHDAHYDNKTTISVYRKISSGDFSIDF